jgi:hypothetical protein
MSTFKQRAFPCGQGEEKACAILPGNLGQRGEDDESGTLNLITDAVRAEAAAQAQHGRVVSLALPVRPAPVISGPSAPAGDRTRTFLPIGPWTAASSRSTREFSAARRRHL